MRRSLEMLSAQCLQLHRVILSCLQSQSAAQRPIRTRPLPAHRPTATGQATVRATREPRSPQQQTPCTPGKPVDPLQPFIPAGSNLPKVPASSHTVRSAEFVNGAYHWAQLPPERWPEVAVVGRSNVGKSSLINYLLDNTSLAKVSKHPGRTQSINHYLVNRSWWFVDCPGYGYAKASQGRRADWHAMTQRYFTSRATLVDILLLVDASLPPKEMVLTALSYAASNIVVLPGLSVQDLAGVDWLMQRNLPVTLVFTKMDKAKGKDESPGDNILAFRSAVLEASLSVPPHFATSAAAKQGGRQLLQYLAQRRAQAAAEQQAAVLTGHA